MRTDRSFFRVIIGLIGLSVVRGQGEPADPREPELERLWSELAKIPPRDHEAVRELANRANELDRIIHTDKSTALKARWEAETDPKAKWRLKEDVVREAILSRQSQLIIEVATGGEYPAKQVQPPDSTKTVHLHFLRAFDLPDHQFDPGTLAIVIRRMTKNRIEFWTPDHGWLFDGRGRVVNEASPPRRDGHGREWYGAFLPNGSWVTTDLWEMDKVLTFFTPHGKWRREISADDLVPQNEDTSRISLIGWCRCDREGKGFVVSVGSEGGRGQAWVSSGGRHRLLTIKKDPWRLCFPRDLEPKGWIPSDDGKILLGREEASHGSFVGYPNFYWVTGGVCQPEGSHSSFGFWPHTHEVFIGTGFWDELHGLRDDTREFRAEEKTWFYHADGNFAGWISARRIGDDAGDGMLFRDVEDHVVDLAADLSVRRVTCFVDESGAALRPVRLFPDLRLGFFVCDTRLWLASW